MGQPFALWWQDRNIVGKVLKRRIFFRPGVMSGMGEVATKIQLILIDHRKKKMGERS